MKCARCGRNLHVCHDDDSYWIACRCGYEAEGAATEQGAWDNHARGYMGLTRLEPCPVCGAPVESEDLGTMYTIACTDTSCPFSFAGTKEWRTTLRYYNETCRLLGSATRREILKGSSQFVSTGGIVTLSVPGPGVYAIVPICELTDHSYDECREMDRDIRG